MFAHLLPLVSASLTVYSCMTSAWIIKYFSFELLPHMSCDWILLLCAHYIIRHNIYYVIFSTCTSKYFISEFLFIYFFIMNCKNK